MPDLMPFCPQILPEAALGFPPAMTTAELATYFWEVLPGLDHPSRMILGPLLQTGALAPCKECGFLCGRGAPCHTCHWHGVKGDMLRRYLRAEASDGGGGEELTPEDELVAQQVRRSLDEHCATGPWVYKAREALSVARHRQAMAMATALRSCEMAGQRLAEYDVARDWPAAGAGRDEDRPTAGDAPYTGAGEGSEETEC